MKLPPEYAHLTPRDLLRLYTGPGALPCPPELREWLEAARLLDEMIAERRKVRGEVHA